MGDMYSNRDSLCAASRYVEESLQIAVFIDKNLETAEVFLVLRLDYDKQGSDIEKYCRSFLRAWLQVGDYGRGGFCQRYVQAHDI